MDKEIDGIDVETQNLLKQVFNHFDQEDRAARERQIRIMRKLKFYWEGFQRIWFSEVAHDWRTWDLQNINNADQLDDSYYDKPVNIFRAYLESIIAALSIQIPGIKCFPDDANEPLDLQTAAAGDKIAKLIMKHNNVAFLWLHALFILYTEGLVGCYNYTKEDESYGTYKENEYKDEEVEQEAQICPVCKTRLADVSLSNMERDEFAPDDSDIESHDLLKEGSLCPICLVTVEPEIIKEKIIVTRLVGVTEKPKSRQCMEVYGGLYLKTPVYAMRQSEMPYLIFSYETHYANALARYEHLRGEIKLKSGGVVSSSGAYDSYEKWGRLSTQYRGEFPLNVVTMRSGWFRPSAFNVLNDEDKVKELKKKFPDGVKLVLCNDLFAAACNENLDDCWTLTHNPLSDYLQHDPQGRVLVPLQDITNDLMSLVLQTIEHGIPQTFADPEVLNFQQYKETEVAPGSIFPAKPKSGKSIGEAFYEIKTATLSAEIQPFGQKVQEFAQLVVGALPSLFGGMAASSGSKTASEYSMSRAQALQRLQNTWKMMGMWWKEIFGKVIPAYIKDMVDDEHMVELTKNNSFINVFIRKAELQGKLGSIELESSEELPVSWTQQRDVILQLINSGNPELLALFQSPENLNLLKEAIGLDDFVLPGEDDRQKQLEEITQLLNSSPLPDGQPSVMIDPDIDNHQIEAEICRNWLVSDAGRLAKVENPQGYLNVLLHLRQHNQIMQMMAMKQAMQQATSSNGENENGGTKPESTTRVQ